MISRTRLAYTAGVAFLAFLLGVTIPAFATSLSSFNSHSLSLSQTPGSPGYKDHIGPPYEMFWTTNTSLLTNLPPPSNTVTGTTGFGLANGTFYHYDCYGPNIVATEPAGTPRPSWANGGNMSFTTPPAPGYVLIIIDMSQYCKLVSVTNP
jgi:hypothetical protein